MNVANTAELDAFLQRYPDTKMLEILMPDNNGILRCKRIQRREFHTLFEGGFKVPISTPLLNILSDQCEGLDPAYVAGDPDQLLLPISGTLAPIPWVDSATAQVLTGFTDLQANPAWVDPRNCLTATLEQYRKQELRPVVATELEFYLLAPSDSPNPQPLQGRIVGTNKHQKGIQYCMADDLWECDAYLDDVREACELQAIPLTAIHSEFSSGQWEINTEHVDDPVTACDHGMLLKRIVKGVARKHGLAATFMAKPFGEHAGSGLHIHTSVYNKNDENIFSDPNAEAPPAMSDALRHAIGGLAVTMAESMAIFAPNANSYRRFKPGSYAPFAPSWGYNHREVALRIPVSSDSNRRVEHRVAGADANPYLVMSAVLAGIHYGMNAKCDPGPETLEGTEFSCEEVTLPNRWDKALELFRNSEVLPQYLGQEYCKAFACIRQWECDEFHSQVTNVDHEWYLRAL